VILPPYGACQAPREVWIDAGACKWSLSLLLNAWRVLRAHSGELAQVDKPVEASRYCKLLDADLCLGLFQGWGERMGSNELESVGQ
jgi:hypothetical protein